ncbi:hypothetical protein Val02_31160 [Virgisporangium aliadipatigenens]|uniref:Glycosyltransferase 2-like domain-containing protein n=1 Tax=Virgisporangium aliadipatigenens TaxID=741659 RepID=A0A8J3YLS7_9ACTN|nr:glycosyltransferase [Virgisporangium aliadipatigenens]GIJ46230.1 hypothetical protein Val02_31160 [Virgisporangium aliadipatigenens]
MSSPFLRNVYEPIPAAGSLDLAPLPAPWPVTVAVVARDEERAIGRCLDSVLAAPVDAVLVLDTGSTDRTLAVVAERSDPRLEVVSRRWENSFAAARNAAMKRARTGWIMFVDADEWLAPGTAELLRPCLSGFETDPDIGLAALAPNIIDADSGVQYRDIARIMPTWSLRWHGAVHEYPHVPGLDVVPGLLGVELGLLHDGYRPQIAKAKGKRERNTVLAARARHDEPENPRWIFFALRDGMWDMDSAAIVELCTALTGADRRGRGDRHSPESYHRRALAHACTRLAQLGDWIQVFEYCRRLDRMSPPASPDTVYFRGLHELFHGAGATPAALLAATRARKDADTVARSGLDPQGRHLDALIGAYLHELKGRDAANAYLSMCHEWTDPFFDGSRRRGRSARDRRVSA